MNVVGRVGSLISQGVYSVATPFHPFGGAVDIIVVEQQDGTYRTTPWYVRFGKFQGVLKGAVKVVRISVNGVEADFHMYLDNSGEAYFFREVVSEKDDDGYQDLKISHLLESTQEDNINDQSSHPNGSVSDAEDTESLNGHGFLRTDEIGNGKFHDNHSQDSLVESPVYSAYRYESLDHVEDLVKSQVLDSEVVLVTRDGHVLLAPISSCAENADNLQLSTPHFDLYPGDVEEVAIEHLHVSADFARNKEDLSNSKDVWPDNLLGDLEASTSNSRLENFVPINEDNISNCVNEACEDGQKSSHHAQEAQNPENCSSEDIHGSMTRNDVFKSCLELSELNSDAEKDSLQNECFVSDGLAKDNGTHGLEETSTCSHPSVQESKAGRDIKIETNDSIHVPTSVASCSRDSPAVQVQVDDAEKSSLRDGGMRHLGSKSVSFNLVIEDLEQKEDESRDESQELGAENCKSDIFESQSGVSDQGINSGFEISLCGELLRAGMGLDSANEAFNAHRVTKEEFKVSGSSIIKNEKLIVRYKERYLPWDKAAPILLGMTVFGLDFPPEPVDAIHVEQVENPKSGEEEDNSRLISTPSRTWRLWSIPFRRAKPLQRNSSNASSEDVFVDSESHLQSPRVGQTISGFEDKEFPPKKFLRTNIPTSEQIASLNLKDGQNKIAFSFSTMVLGEQQVDAHIYLWKWNTRIVISDVDGTITRSDVLGQFMPLFGKDWTQSGVARLFSAIKENGYQLLFLSARAIVQAYLTRNFLVNLKQDGKALPNGPVVISPDGLIPSLYREVIRRKPHEFKIACLEDIRALFPSDYNPFYAGFGNRATDEISYRKIGIPEGKIFIINPKGEVAIHRCIDAKSYTSLHTLVNDMFPPTSLVEQEDFNSWNYWKIPLPDIDC